MFMLFSCIFVDIFKWSRERLHQGLLPKCHLKDSNSGIYWVPPLACGTSLVAQTVKHPPTMWETWVQSLGWDDLLEKEMATHSSILAWKIPWMEEPGRLQSMGLQRGGHNWATSQMSVLQYVHIHTHSHMYNIIPPIIMWTWNRYSFKSVSPQFSLGLHIVGDQ